MKTLSEKEKKTFKKIKIQKIFSVNDQNINQGILPSKSAEIINCGEDNNKLPERSFSSHCLPKNLSLTSISYKVRFHNLKLNLKIKKFKSFGI